MRPDDPLAIAGATAVRTGDLATLERLLTEHPGIANAQVVGRKGGTGRRCTLCAIGRVTFATARLWSSCCLPRVLTQTVAPRAAAGRRRHSIGPRAATTWTWRRH